jgi:parallel beta-helix repeat protein
MTKDQAEECPIAMRDSGAPTEDGSEPEVPDAGTDASDAAPPVAPADCRATDTTACSVTAFSPEGVTTRTSAAGGPALQQVISATTDGAFITVAGHCGAATLSGRVGVTITGPTPTTGCGFFGPGATDLTAEIDGLTVVGSSGVVVKFVNLVNSATDGLSFTNSSAPFAFCNCAANNLADGLQVNNTQIAAISQNRSERNNDGIQVNNSPSTSVFNNTTTANIATGIVVANSDFASVVSNQVTNNGTGILVQASNFVTVAGNTVTNNAQFGILFQGVTNSTASGNTLTGNGNQVDNFINCQAGSSGNFGSNVPAGCGLSILVPTPIGM